MNEQVQAILNELNRKAALDPQLRQIMKKIEKGKATLADTAALSDRASDLLGEVLGAAILDTPEDVREAVCEGLLRERYDSMNETLAAVQTALDESQGIHLTPQKAPFPTERVQQIAHSLLDPNAKPETIRRRANKPVATVAKSFHDDYIRVNAKLRNDLGLKPIIQRFGTGCCAWCAAVTGKWSFGEQPEDIFRRHDNCDCVIIYDTQVLRGQKTDSGRSKTWEEVDPKEVAAQGFQPTVNTPDAARKLQENAVSGLTLSGERDIMTGRGSGTGSASETVHYSERIGKLDPDDKKAVAASLAEFERKYKDSSIEHCRVITKSGEVYEVHGDRYTVDTSLLGELMRGSTNEHNHVTGESQYSFSWEDLIGSANDGSSNVLAFDEKFRYAMTFPESPLSEDMIYDAYHNAKDTVLEDMCSHPEKIPIGDEQHETIKRACQKLGIKYSRKRLA